MSDRYNPLSAVDFVEVESGTEIENPRTGEKHIVTDESAVFHGRRAYVTARTIELLRSRAVKEATHD